MARFPTSSDSDVPTGPPSPYRWLVLLGVWLVYMTFGMTTASLAPLVGPITRDLGISHGSMGMVFGIWQFVFIVSAVPCGGLHDRIGVSRSLFIGALIIAASALLRSFAFDYASLCLAVAIFGIGGPIVSTGSPKIVSGWFTGAERGFAMGIYVTGSAIGTITSLSLTNSVLMPALGDDWHQVLRVWSALAFSAGLIWLGITALPEMRAKEKHAASQPRRPQREVVADLLRLPAVRILLAMSIGTFMFNHSLNNWLPEILRARGMSPAEAGFWATTPTLVGILGALTLPRLATPARRHAMLCGLFLSAVLATLLLQASSGPLLVAGMILQGIARSSLVTVTMLTLVETPGVGEKNAGTVSGLFFSAAELGGASGPMILGFVHDATGGFAAGLGLLTSVTLVLFMGALHLSRTASRAAPAGG